MSDRENRDDDDHLRSGSVVVREATHADRDVAFLLVEVVLVSRVRRE